MGGELAHGVVELDAHAERARLRCVARDGVRVGVGVRIRVRVRG